MNTEADCRTCENTGLVTCTHPTTETDTDGDRVCLTCDEIIDGQQVPQQTLCRDCQI